MKDEINEKDDEELSDVMDLDPFLGDDENTDLSNQIVTEIKISKSEPEKSTIKISKPKLKKLHMKNKQSRCKNCNKKIGEENMTEHLKICKEEQLVSCHICGHISSNLSNLKRHTCLMTIKDARFVGK